MADVMAAGEGQVEPDAQATVTDFIDYTEYLPSDLERSLTLIGKLDGQYLDCTTELDQLLEDYGALGPTAAAKRAPPHEAQDLRADISDKLAFAVRYREASFAEAGRLADAVDRHYKRLSSIKLKLEALPEPPSREPTPVPAGPAPQQQQQLPQQAQVPPTRVSARENASGPRIKLRIANERVTSHATRGPGGGPRPRKKVMRIVPGEVLPPRNPESDAASDYSELEPTPTPTPEPSPAPKETPRKSTKKLKLLKPAKPHRPPPRGAPKPAPALLVARKERPPRPPGTMGTNVHSKVAGISTSNALLKLTPPPPDAAPGSAHAPWMRLTEYEMARLRKRMKKNAIWAPSDTMIRRELCEAGRGPDAYARAKRAAEAAGRSFTDCDDLAAKDRAQRDRALGPGEIRLDPGRPKLVNKGMSLNVQKKAKKAAEQREQREQARLEAEQAAANLGALGSSFRTLFENRPAVGSPSTWAGSPGYGAYFPLPPTPDADKKPAKAAAPRKRKREASSTAGPTVASASTPTEEARLQAQLYNEMANAPGTPASGAKPAKKHQKKAAAQAAASANANGATTTTTTTTTVPLAPAAPSPTKPTALEPTQPNTTTRKQKPLVSLVLKDPSSSATAANTAPKTGTAAHASGTPVPASATSAAAGAASLPSRPGSSRGARGSHGSSDGVKPLSREHLRRKSATPLREPATPLAVAAPTLASRRSKRPAPGPVTSASDGGAAVSIGRRKNAPRKRGSGGGGAATAAAERRRRLTEEEPDEEIDPDEPRYCVCGDVSYGTMVMCENENCEKEWFHLECVGLSEPPARRAKWWCPDCSASN